MENNYSLVKSIEYHPNGQQATVTINTNEGKQRQFYIRTEKVVDDAIKRTS